MKKLCGLARFSAVTRACAVCPGALHNEGPVWRVGGLIDPCETHSDVDAYLTSLPPVDQSGLRGE